MEEQQITPTSVTYAGTLSLSNADGVDIGSLEGRAGTTALLSGVQVEKGTYDCYYAAREDGKGIGALIIVSTRFEGEALEATEKIGEFTVGLSNVVGFFRSPKKEYTLNQLADYVKELEDGHGKNRVWVRLNSKQFMSPASQAAATFVPAYAHRNANGEIDAIQIEFNRKESALLEKGAQANG